MDPITAKVIIEAMRKGARNAIRENKRLGLSYHIVRGDYLFLIDPDGRSEKVKKLKFYMRKINICHLQGKIGKYNIQSAPSS